MRAFWVIALLILAGCADAEAPLDSDGDGLSDEKEIARGLDPYSIDSDGDGVPDGEDVEPDVPAVAARVVVAVLDTAINPYHVHFQRAGGIPDEILATFIDGEGRTPMRVQLAQNGTYEERREADADFWDNIEDGTMYHFEGTNIVAVSHGDNIIDGGSHGTATSGAVLDANPDAIIAFSQGFNAASEDWASSQPWIDLMSESYGPPGSPPTWFVEGSNTAEANRVKWQQGGIPIGASDNSPALAPIDSTAGPPWVVGVAGDHDDGCREPLSGNVPDFTADFTQELPSDGTIDGYHTTSGTSFATPMTAGVFSAVLLQVREAWGHAGGITPFQTDTAQTVPVLAIAPDGGPQAAVLDNAGLRHVMNMTATYYSADGCNGGVPVAPAPWVSQGWGHIGPEIIETAVACIVENQATFATASAGDACPTKPAEAVEYMQQVHRARQEAWAYRG